MKHLVCAAAVCASAVLLAAQPAPLDIGIINARLINGLAGIAGAANVGIRNGRIQMVDDSIARAATLVIDAKGQVVAPGFIDVHSHGLETLTRSDIRDAKALLA